MAVVRTQELKGDTSASIRAHNCCVVVGSSLCVCPLIWSSCYYR